MPFICLYEVSLFVYEIMIIAVGIEFSEMIMILGPQASWS